ncbi:hypothetical protein KSP40_PGU017716 [Platanthera guangdongensis]|uniref:Uncharacterized protein n=1 Tax=Platanthera guangdongensis TaxID=2320717 RepID=A0ABR2M5S1_9ASPA
MFSVVVATGHHSCTPNTINDPPESFDERVMSDGEHVDVEVNKGPATHDDTSTVSKKRRKLKNKSVSSVLEDLTESSKTISRCIQEPPPKASSEFSIQRALNKLAMYPEVIADEDFNDFVITYFMDKSHRETFLCLPDSQNVKWLRNRFVRGG